MNNCFITFFPAIDFQLFIFQFLLYLGIFLTLIKIMGKNCINLNQIWWFQSLILGFLEKTAKSPLLSTLKAYKRLSYLVTLQLYQNRWFWLMLVHLHLKVSELQPSIFSKFKIFCHQSFEMKWQSTHYVILNFLLRGIFTTFSMDLQIQNQFRT